MALMNLFLQIQTLVLYVFDLVSLVDSVVAVGVSSHGSTPAAIYWSAAAAAACIIGGGGGVGGPHRIVDSCFGIGNPIGALMGGLLIGITGELATGWINPSYKPAVYFLVLLIVLLLRPNGILGSKGRQF